MLQYPLMNVVLFFQSTKRDSWRAKLAGAYRFAREQDWILQVIPSNATPGDIRSALELWRPIGCLVDRAMSTGRLHRKVFRGIPFVYLDQPEPGPNPSVPVLAHDNRAVAEMAAGELLSLGLDDYAYIPYGDLMWDHERESAFRSAVEQRGRRCHVMHGGTLRDFLTAIPKPCGVFAANDAIAVEAIHTARHLGLSIPDDLAILGVDNEELLCESERPTLSSIENDFENAGYQLASLLHEELRSPGGAPRLSTYGPLRVVRRASTSLRSGDNPRARAAEEYIRAHLADPELSLDAIADAVGCSRRLLSMRFRQARGHSVTDEITARRIEKAKQLLADRWRTLGSIPSLCGYRSESYFKHRFKAVTGLTMREWRTRPR